MDTSGTLRRTGKVTFVRNPRTLRQRNGKNDAGPREEIWLSQVAPGFMAAGIGGSSKSPISPSPTGPPPMLRSGENLTLSICLNRPGISHTEIAAPAITPTVDCEKEFQQGGHFTYSSPEIAAHLIGASRIAAAVKRRTVVRRLQRPGWQRLADAGSHDQSARAMTRHPPGLTCRPRTDGPARHRAASVRRRTRAETIEIGVRPGYRRWTHPSLNSVRHRPDQLPHSAAAIVARSCCA